MATFEEEDTALSTRTDPLSKCGHVLSDSFCAFNMTEDLFARNLEKQLGEWQAEGIRDAFVTVPQKYANYYAVVARFAHRRCWWRARK